jgi:hypothetical protein
VFLVWSGVWSLVALFCMVMSGSVLGADQLHLLLQCEIVGSVLVQQSNENISYKFYQKITEHVQCTYNIKYIYTNHEWVGEHIL